MRFSTAILTIFFVTAKAACPDHDADESACKAAGCFFHATELCIPTYCQDACGGAAPCYGGGCSLYVDGAWTGPYGACNDDDGRLCTVCYKESKAAGCGDTAWSDASGLKPYCEGKCETSRPCFATAQCANYVDYAWDETWDPLCQIAKPCQVCYPEPDRPDGCGDAKPTDMPTVSTDAPTPMPTKAPTPKPALCTTSNCTDIEACYNSGCDYYTNFEWSDSSEACYGELCNTNDQDRACKACYLDRAEGCGDLDCSLVEALNCSLARLSPDNMCSTEVEGCKKYEFCPHYTTADELCMGKPMFKIAINNNDIDSMSAEDQTDLVDTLQKVEAPICKVISELEDVKNVTCSATVYPAYPGAEIQVNMDLQSAFNLRVASTPEEMGEMTWELKHIVELLVMKELGDADSEEEAPFRFEISAPGADECTPCRDPKISKCFTDAGCSGDYGFECEMVHENMAFCQKDGCYETQCEESPAMDPWFFAQVQVPKEYQTNDMALMLAGDFCNTTADQCGGDMDILACDFIHLGGPSVLLSARFTTTAAQEAAENCSGALAAIGAETLSNFMSSLTGLKIQVGPTKKDTFPAMCYDNPGCGAAAACYSADACDGYSNPGGWTGAYSSCNADEGRSCQVCYPERAKGCGDFDWGAMSACADSCATSIACYLSTCLDNYDLDEGKWTAPYEGCEAARACEVCFPNKPSGCGCTAAAIEDEKDGCVVTMSPTTAKAPTEDPVVEVPAGPGAMSDEDPADDYSAAGRVGVAVAVVALLAANLLC